MTARLAPTHVSDGWWTITHRPSGRTLTPHHFAEPAAHRMVELLAGLDWSSPDPLVVRRHERAVWAALRQVCRELDRTEAA